MLKHDVKYREQLNLLPWWTLWECCRCRHRGAWRSSCQGSDRGRRTAPDPATPTHERNDQQVQPAAKSLTLLTICRHLAWFPVQKWIVKCSSSAIISQNVFNKSSLWKICRFSRCIFQLHIRSSNCIPFIPLSGDSRLAQVKIVYKQCNRHVFVGYDVDKLKYVAKRVLMLDRLNFIAWQNYWIQSHFVANQPCVADGQLDFNSETQIIHAANLQ